MKGSSCGRSSRTSVPGSGARVLCGDGRSRPPLRCFERSVHATQFDLCQDLVQHELPMIIDAVILELVEDVFTILLFEIIHRGRLEIFAILSNMPVDSGSKFAHERKTFRQLAVQDLGLWISQSPQEVYQNRDLRPCVCKRVVHVGEACGTRPSCVLRSRGPNL